MSYNYDFEKNDCMVLYLEEWDSPSTYSKVESEKKESRKVDTRAYVVYDAVTKTYIIYGKRRDHINEKSPDYTLYFYKAKSVVNYFNYALCEDNEVSYSIYSFNDLIEYGEAFDDKYSYHDFHSKRTNLKELFSYDGKKGKEIGKELKDLLELMKSEAIARLYLEEQSLDK